jgi:hypothetical protein
VNAARYLLIPADYARELGGLRWSALRDAIEDGNGRTFALVEEVAAFLDGFASRGRLIHFAHVLHFLRLLHGPYGPRDFRYLTEAWREAGRPARTAGAFAARLCELVPGLAGPVGMDDLRTWLTLRLGPDECGAVGEDPPLSPDVFEACIGAALLNIPAGDLVHWFRHGQPPPGGEELARELLDARPRSLGDVLTEVSRHERLCGAVPMVERLVGALSLPPRRLADRQLPLGGYSDIGTRGQPEQILPGQFALDELEFLRRHAEHELLYYRREEPHSPTRDRLVVLLDQGVRTWGTVRLALAACVLALGQLARRRRLALGIATTVQAGQVIDPLAAEPAVLAEVLGASDLSANPGLALERVLEERVEGHRDVVLLTAPRNLDEPDVQAAARRAEGQTRLFAVGVAASGAVTFSEMRHGLPVPLGRFHLDLEVPPPPPRPACGAWTGPVEPVPFPFRFGPGSNHEPFLFAFDESGEWLLANLSQGMLLLVRRDGKAHEFLPRVHSDEQQLTDVHGIQGVAGGFAVVGCVPNRVIVAHYDLAAREVRLHAWPTLLGQLARGLEWRYLRKKGVLLVRLGDWFAGVHLSTGRRLEPFPDELRWLPDEPPSRVSLALPVTDGCEPSAMRGAWRRPRLQFDARKGSLEVHDGPPWDPIEPLVDGKPGLVGRALLRAECRGGCLAVLFLPPDRGKELWLFGWPGHLTVSTLALPYDRDAFALSPDGLFLAVQRGPCQVEVRDTGPGCRKVGESPMGKFHNNVSVALGEQWLSVAIDRRVHLLAWHDGVLRHTHDQGTTGEVVARHADALGIRGAHAYETRAQTGRVPGFLKYDRWRFRLAAWRNLVAVVDQFGEVFLFEHHGELVCGFFAFRQQMAGFLADGTGWGAEALLDQPVPADAAQRFGKALREAWERGEGTIT